MGELTQNITVSTTQNIRPEIALVIKNGAVVYDGEVATIPADALNGGLVLMLMHPQTKARMDGLIMRNKRAAREEAKKEARRANQS